MSEWVEELRKAVAASSQGKVAKRLGVSTAIISQTLRGRYNREPKKLETAVRGELMRETLECPVLGEILKSRCQHEQLRPFAATNPQRVTLYHACRNGCPNALASGGDR